MKTYRELLQETENKLLSACVEDAGYEAKILVSEVEGQSFSWVVSHRSDPIAWTLDQRTQFENMVTRRMSREPLQYILGTWEFYGRRFCVGAGVLIPRADTETVVEEAMSFCTHLPEPTAIDLCAGSGCIGITLALECGLHVTEAEIDDCAARYLAQNIRSLAPQVSLRRVNVLDAEQLRSLPRAGLVVANPPYIPTSDIDALSPEVRREPTLALDGGEDGLRFYRAISRNAPLLSGGRLVYEIGIGQVDDVCRIMEENGYSKLHIRKDMNGIPRAVSGQYQ